MIPRPALRPFIYTGRCTNVVDGDTIDATLDLGFRCSVAVRLRLKGLDTPELRLEQLVAGKVARWAVQCWMEDHGPDLMIESGRLPGGWSRWEADVWGFGGEHLNGWLLAEGLARPSEKHQVNWTMEELETIEAWNGGLPG